MSNFQRLISYIYSYEGSIKGKNIGFAKLEARNVQCKITVNVKKIFAGGNPIGVYLLSNQGEVRIGTLYSRNGAGEFRTTVNSANVEDSGRGIEEFYGLSVHDEESAWRSYMTIWEDSVAHVAEVELADVTAEKLSEKQDEETDENDTGEELLISKEIEAELEAEEAAEAAAPAGAEEAAAPDMDMETAVAEPEAETAGFQTNTEEPETAGEPDWRTERSGIRESLMRAQASEMPATEIPPQPACPEIREPEAPGPEIPQPVPAGPEIETPCPAPAPSRPEIPQPAPSRPEIPQPAPSRPEIPQPAPSRPEIPQPAPSRSEPIRGGRQFKTSRPTDFIPAHREGAEAHTAQEMWEFFKKKYAKILAFDYADGCEILTIKPQDIGLLPRDNWFYGNNSFLLHGYYNYRYLILARLHNPEGRPRYLLGVPGNYYSNEKYMASMFGFPDFVLSKKQPSKDSRFGYWYSDIKMGE